MDEEMMYKIILADGRVIGNLTANGNNFVSSEPVDESMFDNNCSPMTVIVGNYEDVHEHAKLVQLAVYDGKYYLAFRDISEQEIREQKIRSDLDYLAMMTDTELGE